MKNPAAIVVNKKMGVTLADVIVFVVIAGLLGWVIFRF